MHCSLFRQALHPLPLLVLALVAGGTPAARAQLVATRIDAERAPALVRDGPDAVGGIGDWALGNGTVCAVVSDPSHESDLATTGGGLVDLGLCGRADDQFLLYQELLEGRLDDPVRVGEVRAEVDATTARLLTRADADGLRVETRYELDMEAPRRLRVETRVACDSEEHGRLSRLGGAVANVRGLTPFALSLHAPSLSRGFVHPAFAGAGRSAVLHAASPADVVVAVGAAELEPGIAYGQRVVGAHLEHADGGRQPLSHFFFVDGLASTLVVFARPFWWGDGRSLGWLQAVQTRFMDLDAGSQLVLEQEIWVGDRADVASVTDLLLPRAPLLSGRADDPSTVVHVDADDGSPFTEVRADADGRFAARVPPGEWVVRLRAAGGREVEHRVLVGAAGADLGTLPVGPPARVRLPRGAPMRLVFVGRDGTPSPDFADDLRGYAVVGAGGLRRPTGAVRDLQLTGTARDPEAVSVAPGRYRVYATRGPEFSLGEVDLDAVAGETVVLGIPEPVRELETPGWIGADLHVHSAASLDTSLAPASRLASFVAQGGEVLVSTDHENVADMAPLVRELGLADRLATIAGLEVTSEVRTALAPYTIGHANAFPMSREPFAYRRGAVTNEGRRWREVIADLRARPGERLIQLNHPRFDEPGPTPRAFLSHMGPAAAPYDPARPLSQPPNAVLVERDPVTGTRDLDFDAIELLNGWHLAAYRRTRSDWFSFLLQGERLVATANSDSHFLDAVVAAPRSYVRMDDDSIAGFEPAAFVRSARAGRVFGSNGPFVEVALGDAGIGDTHRGGEGVLRGSVRAASWVPVSTLRVWVSGQLVHQQPVSRGEAFAIPLHFERDAFVTVEVEGEADERFAAVLPGHTPFAFTNAIWVDADADGVWTPPGLPPAP